MLSISPVLFEIGPFTVRWYGLFMAVSVGVGFFCFLKGGRSLGYDDDFLYNLAFFVVLSGIVGARAVYVMTNWDVYAKEPGMIWRIDLGGLSFHGAVIGGILGALPLHAAARSLVFGSGGLRGARTGRRHFHRSLGQFNQPRSHGAHHVPRLQASDPDLRIGHRSRVVFHRPQSGPKASPLGVSLLVVCLLL